MTLFFQALDCKLSSELLALLDSPLTNQESRAFIVKALKSMQCSLQYGDQVSAQLNANPVWKQFEAQKHDLFISNESTAGYLTANPGVAGYLTSVSKPVPTVPPPMEDSAKVAQNSTMGNPLL